ncbi:glycerophosphodiester phosphodiesterase family protein [Dyella choica]|nr:glycerophosphodiester phosphodiesterase family protein [Dyella choica]
MKHKSLGLALAVACLFSSMQSIIAHAGCYDPRRVIEAMATPDEHGINPVVIAHRGLWRADTGTTVIAPENSPIALQKADEACIEAVELDVKTLADGTPVVMHDFNLGGTTDIGDLKGQPLFDPYKNTGYNPLASNTSLSDFRQLRLKNSRTMQTIGAWSAPLIKDVYDYYYRHRMSTALVWDVKTKEAVIALAKLVDADRRDYSHETTMPPISAADITVLKINATVYPNGADYASDMKKNGVTHAPKVIPIYTTNMEKALNDIHSSPLLSLESWKNSSSGYFLAPEIDLKQENGLLSETMNFATQNNLSVGIFNAIPDWLGGGETAGSSGIPSDKAFVNNNGECCYQLSSKYAEFNGQRDTDDKRGDWSFLYSQHFGSITTDRSTALIQDLNLKGRATDRYGKALWRSYAPESEVIIVSMLLN